ncbi:hypothetical protein AtubIFM57258_010580 [Aspergillus tubingensis]|uniref:DUF7730 domain-containing protein n=4 Tax=Aspergillus subgen. Circumdati TaxID=2720871 RepID=A0A1L9NID7_ASPTC|nr:uncharacterized protein BO83DRAFT_67474 [Aspergillus eucalypticola CBS 122712]XP_025475279.1 hypothetical protein BO87DRAFT_172364 [Aspergillus neoniger CBS 115656]XP_025539547.1 hypothetical protein BO79DRAFT_17699 [Aspergillus costaricaensis CBS 115574]OJI89011.1 hypothetical protein ASPTUDRAFT_361812 [Aspergillus tubingensis CBS 134.48]GLB04611.1 hypothetical protein AtubIFM57258_010580 [Aspergillus tubingensis]PWY69263.1 hypothetical protein BO83DRAFT_67474 [Aspergillus eucalypticola CB
MGIPRPQEHWVDAPQTNSTKPSPFLKLPLELRLMIYEYALVVPNEFTDRPMIVINDRGNVFTARGRYRALSMCPSWVGENGRVRSLLSVNRQIHDEVEDFVYSQNTLFFLNSFNLDRLGTFLDTISPTARKRIRSVGFEIFFFVHSQTGVPKRTLKEYKAAARMLMEKLPNWTSTMFYLDPRFYFPSAAVGNLESSARGIWYLATIFGALHKDLHFFPLPSMHRHVMDDAKKSLQAETRASQMKLSIA